MARHRIFIAIDFSEEVIKEIARVQEVLGNVKLIGKMTELENLHLTLKFLGEIDDEKLERVRKRLKEVKFSEMELKLGVAGTFSFRGQPRIVWIKVMGKGIFELQKKIDDVLEGEGFGREERFMSHLTIARIKHVGDKTGFIDYVNGMGVKAVEFNVNEFKLKESELRRLGPVYKDLEIYEGKGIC